MADQKFQTDVTADDSQFVATMQHAVATLQSTAMEMQASLTATFSKIQSAIVGIGAVIAGGGAFGAAVGKSAELTKESISLSKALGITATEASVLSVALGDVFVTSDQMLAANNAVTRQLLKGEDAFTKLGVATRDQNGQFRNSLDIIMDVNKHLLTFAEGTDRNVEGMKIYKKAWAEVAPVMKLTAEGLEDSRAKAAALGLVVGTESIEQFTKYRKAQNDTNDVLKATQKVIGDAVMPVLTDLGNWFAETGPDRVEFMRKTMAVLVATFYGVKFAVEEVYYGLKTVFESLWEVIKAFVEISVVAVLKFADTAERAFRWDFKGAKAAWQAGSEQQVDVWKKASENIVKIAETNRDKMIQSMNDARAGMVRAIEGGLDPKTTTPTTTKGGAGSTGADTKDKFSKWEAELAAQRDAYERMKLEQGSFELYTKQMEADFWEKKKADAGTNKDLLAQIEKKYYTVVRDIRKEAFDAEIADIKRQMAAAETNAEQRINLANQLYGLEVQRHKAGSKEAIEALKEVQKAYDEWAKQQREIRDLQSKAERDYQVSRVELERANLDTMEQLGQINHKQHLEALKNLKEIEYQIEAKALDDKKALMADDPTTDPVKYQEVLNQIRAIKEKHEVEMRQIDGQIQVESVQVWRDIGSAVTGGFSTAVKGVIMGTQSIGQAFKNLGQTVMLAMVDLGAKMAAQWLMNAIIAKVIDKGAKTSEISAAAAAAAANAFASTAAIPIVGPALAPEAAAAAYAGAMSWQGALLSAAGGLDVPAGLNPMVQLHKKEMVLPEHLADAVRDMAAGGGDGSGGDVIHIHAMDAQSLAGYLRSNSHALAPSLRRLSRRLPAPKK